MAGRTTRDAGLRPGPQPMAAGWHPVEYTCELVGTFALLFFGTFAVVACLHPDSPLVAAPGVAGWRRLLLGLLFVGTTAVVAVTPLGRRSGAHLNPAITLGFFVMRHLQWRDLAGYSAAQCVGAVLGVAAAALLAPSWVSAPEVDYAITRPGAGVSDWGAVWLEAWMTGLVVLVVFAMVSSARLARFTPLVVWLLIAVLVWLFAPLTGTSVNPARSLGPAVVGTEPAALWVYVVGPLSGALLVGLAWRLAGARHTLTAKIFHDSRYESVARCDLPAMPSGTRR